MRIGIVSDSHGHVENCWPAVRMLESLQVEVILHCGDVGTAEVLRQFAQWPVHFVLGNCDDPQTDWGEADQALLQGHGKFAELELDGKKIALLHSDDIRKFHSTVHSGEYDLVCYGHTHVAKQENVGKTLVLNPGALYRANRHTIAIYDTESGKAEIVTVG